MSVLFTLLNPPSANFQARVKDVQKLVGELRRTVRRIALGGPEAAPCNHIARDKLQSRERVKALIDSGSTFLNCRHLPPMAGTVATFLQHRRAP